MKKVLVVCLTILMMLSMTLTAFAAPGKFVSSPSGNLAPGVINFDPADDDCTGYLVITPYSERDTLPDSLEALMKKAYDQIKNSKDLTELNADLAALAKKLKIKGADLAVSDLFDIRVEGCTVHEGHHEFDIVVSADTLKHFVGLLHMKENGEWELIKDAKVISNGEHLAFSVDTMSPFAIVVDTSANPSQTGDTSLAPVYITVMAISALAIIVILAKSKKQKA